MAGLSIPGVNDKYKSNEIVEGLMKVERIPLTREQEHLESIKKQQDAWRTVNQKMSSLRDSVKSLYSFDNPFNNKLASSSEEYAITASAGREAAYESFQIDVITPATADRFLSSEIEKAQKVPAGLYVYKVGDKQVQLNWKGGKIEDFVSSLNKRSKDIIKASLIGVSKDKKALLIESLKTGAQSKLIFENAALDFALSSNMVQKVVSKSNTFGTSFAEIKSPTVLQNSNTQSSSLESTQVGMPIISSEKVKIINQEINVPPRSGFSITIPEQIANDKSKTISFNIKAKNVDDITQALNSKTTQPILPDPGNVTFAHITVDNNQSSVNMPKDDTPKVPLTKIETDSVLFIQYDNNTEKEIQIPNLAFSTDGVNIKIPQVENLKIKSLVLRNANTGVEYSVSKIEAFDSNKDLGYAPKNAISTAGDAIIKYEGITITRPDNKIDDVIPHVTLNLTQATDRTATIKIEPDTESAKDALINFVGRYNQAITEINILSQNKPEIIAELDYLSSDEKKEYQEKLGLFFSDFSLTNLKSSLQSIITAPYTASENSEITMLSQIGISTNATNFAGYNPGKLRGYLEINEKVLDEKLKSNLNDVKILFGFDSDGDLIIDSGIGSRLDKHLTAYVQSGGIFANKNSTLDRQIKSSEQKITKLETQLDQKEAELKNKYGVMESTLNRLENQQNSINNFNKQNEKR